MNASAQVHPAPRIDRLVLAAVSALGVLMLLLAFVADDARVALAPLALAMLVLAAVRAPLRQSLLAVGFLCLTLENPAEIPANGLWRSPLYGVGALFLTHLNLTIPARSLVFSGLDLTLVLLAAVWAWRRMTGSPTDVRGHVPPAPPLRSAALLCIAAIFFVWGYGLVQDGADFNNSLWQVFRLIYLPCVFLLCCAGIRGAGDGRAFAIALIAAALIRACLAGYLRHLFPNVEQMPHATVHADSMLFAGAFLLVVALLLEYRTRRALLLALFALPLLSWGMIANARRLAWAELAAGLLVFYWIAPATRFKRRLGRTVAISLPVLALYGWLGWTSPSAAFAPVRTMRSMIDPTADASTRWRDWENYDLYFTVRKNPLLGTGLGHGYLEVVPLPDISTHYAIYRFAPHNSILGLFAFAGALGFFALWLIIPLGVFFAVRCHRHAIDPRGRVTALGALGILVSYSVHCFGDMGLGTWTSVFTVAPALALVAKQAVASGAWPLPRPRG